MGDDIDDMDSLFEGMVLVTQDQNQDSHQHVPPPPEPGDSPAPPSSSSPQPLDENMFSDLTIINPLQTLEDDTSSSTSTPLVSRQISRKKKKGAVGFRIGYGRGDTSFEDDQVSLNDDDDLAGNSNPASSSLDPEQQLQQSDDSIDAEAKLELLKAQIADKLNRARDLAASVSASRKESIKRKREVANRFNLATVRFSDLEKQLEEACEAENFEAADRLSDDLAASEKEEQALLASLREAEARCDAIDSKMLEALLCQIPAEEECASLLHRFSEDAVNDADLILKKAQVQSSQQGEEWFSSVETLEVKTVELEIEMHLVKEARQALDGSIHDLIQEDNREKEALFKKKDVLTDELQKLLALVKEKEMEIAENDNEIKQVEERIADVVSNFQEMQSSINTKYVDLQSDISQMDVERQVLSKEKEEIDRRIAEEEDSGAQLRKLATSCADEAKMYQQVVGLRNSLMSTILKSREDKLRLTNSEEKLSEDVQVLQQEVSAARASLQERSSTKSTIQQNIASLKQRIFFIEKRVPELEAEKKVAAAARNFKEAARIASEAKSLSGEKDAMQMEMNKTILELEKVEEEIKCTIERLEEMEGLISSKKKEVGLARFQRLLLVAGAAKAESLAASELGDPEEASLLLTEAEAADSEAKELQSTYNFKEEELANFPKHFISMELVANIGQQKLAELAASVLPPAVE